MATMVAAVEAEFTTDFAILHAAQRSVGASAGGFTGSIRGAVAAACGTKYASVRVRAERWDGRPSCLRGWEDIDEWPFEEIPGDGPLLLAGFDLGTVGLDVEGLGRSRVVIMARGRQRYGYSADNVGSLDELIPEEWLLQFFPDPEGLDALASDPRRLSGAAPHSEGPRRASSAALHAWKQTGWDYRLHAFPGYRELWLALYRLGRPATTEEIIVTAFAGHGPRSPVPRTDPLATPLPGPQYAGVRPALAEDAGLHDVATMGDLIQAMRNLGLLVDITRRGVTQLVPNAVPGMIWEVVEMSETERNGYRTQIGYADFRDAADDMTNLLGWAAGGRLTATAREIGVRLAIYPEEVLGALDLMVLTHAIAPEPYSGEVERHLLYDQPLNVRRRE